MNEKTRKYYQQKDRMWKEKLSIKGKSCCNAFSFQTTAIIHRISKLPWNTRTWMEGEIHEDAVQDLYWIDFRFRMNSYLHFFVIFLFVFMKSESIAGNRISIKR